MTSIASQSACSSAKSSSFVPAGLDATRWANLQPLYQSLVDRKLNCANCLSGLLLDRSELDAATSEAMANLYIRMTCHTDDEKAKKAYLDFVENVEPELKKIGFALDRKIVSSPLAKELDSKRYEVLLRNMKVDVDLFRDENVPLQTEETRLEQQYDEICGAMMVNFRGQERTMPQMMKFLEETDRKTREEAWLAIADRRLQDADRISEIYDKLIQLRHRIALNAGFPNYRDYTFKRKHRFDYTPAHCEAFHAGAEQVCVPVLRQLNSERAKALNLNPLRPWDLAVDTKGRQPLRPFQTADELVEKSSKVFHRLDPNGNGSSLGAMFDSLRGGGCLDLDSRKGKAPGGYQYQRDFTRKPFIFMNAAGLARDLETMVHEAGHAFHSILCNHDPLVRYRHSPMEFAEVASMSMELLTYPYLDEFYSPEDAGRAKRKHLEALSQMLPWIATIDAFQHWVYTNPNHTRAERAAYWISLNDRFGPAVSWQGYEQHLEIAWQRQLHLFGVPFYYIEYGIAQLGALQLWLQSRRDAGTALANYKKALTLGGSRPLPELFAAAELKFDFGPATMQSLMDEVKKELATLPL